MSYTPTPVQQSKYTQPSDGDSKAATSVDVPIQGLADGVTAGPIIPFNWQQPVSTTNGMNRGWFSVKEQAWYAVGDNVVDALEVSYTDGRTWKSLTGGLGSALTLLDCAFDTSGNGVLIAEASRDVYVGAFSAWATVTWTHHASALPSAATDGRLTYDAVHSKWIAVYRSGASGIVVATSADGITWTSQTLPASWSGYTGTGAAPKIFYAGGTLVAAFIDDTVSPHILRIIRSSDGGTTWTDVADPAALTTTPSNLSLAYDPAYAVWYLMASTASATEVYKSTNDGVVWAPAVGMGSGYAEFTLLEIVVLCGVLIGLNTDGRLFFSPDLSATWWFATSHKGSAGSPTGMRAADGRIVVWNRADTNAVVSLRHGGAGLEVV